MAGIVVVFNGRNGPGTTVISGAVAGQEVSVINAQGVPYLYSFAPFIVTDGEIIQYDSGDFSMQSFYALLT
jgi:hypothetical protein